MAYYRIAAGVDVVPMGDDAILFRSNTLAVRVEGPMANLLSGRVLPLLTEPRSIDELARHVADMSPDTLRDGLESLVTARVLERLAAPVARAANHPLAAFVAEMGIDPDHASQRLRETRVAVFGLEAHGAHAALELGRLGIGACVLADMFPVAETNSLLMPAMARGPARSRQEAVALLLGEHAPSTRVALAAELSRDVVRAIADECSMLIGCFDQGYETVQHWVNRAAISTRTPALFAGIRTHVATIGPFVVPGESACYMCYRMRSIACEENYDEAMAHERFLNGSREPALSARATATFLSAQTGSILAGEVVKLVALGLPPTLAGRVMEIDSVTLETRFHPVLRVPNCPSCGEKKKPRANPSLAELVAHSVDTPRGDLRLLQHRLVSSRTGIVKHLGPFPKDPVEPAVPYIVRADIANHRFVSTRDDDGDVCSGKGLTLAEARVSAMGEAVERYSAAVHDRDDVTYAPHRELGNAALDPTELVLYAAPQYAELPYAPYEERSTLGWVRGRSLVRGNEVLVPALGVLMNYHAALAGEFLFPITSNGLAAGPTLLDAVWGATAEVLERDAFMIAWLNRLPARRFSGRAHPHPEIADIARMYARRGVDIRLYRMPTDHEVAVFAGIAVERRSRRRAWDADSSGGPAVVIGLGADPDPVLAARKAVLEVCQVRPALRRRMRQPETQRRLRELLDDSRRVTTIDDHDLLYASDEALPRMDFWLDAKEEAFEWTSQPDVATAVHVTRFTAWLEATGRDALYVNLTPPDMSDLGLYTARAILPGFQPIDFGWKERRLGGSRLYTLPVDLGFRTAPATWDTLNQDPHPLA